LGRCAPGAAVASIPLEFGSGGVVAHPSGDASVRPAAAMSADRLKALPVHALYVGTNGSRAALEHARPTLAIAFPYAGSPRPLVAVAVLSGGTGLLAAHLFLRSQLSESLQPPGAHYYLIVVAGIVAALGIIASTLSLLERITRPEVARNE